MSKCDLCGCEEEFLIGCGKCTRLLCPGCEAALPDDDEDEPLCEECF
jgi:hypothetical protein